MIIFSERTALLVLVAAVLFSAPSVGSSAGSTLACYVLVILFIFMPERTHCLLHLGPEQYSLASSTDFLNQTLCVSLQPLRAALGDFDCRGTGLEQLLFQ